MKRVCVFVVGDIGRSPRMQYHALALAKNSFQVDLIGFAGSTPIQDLRSHNNVKIYHMMPTPNCVHNIPRLLGYIVKVLLQSVFIVLNLLRIGWPPDYLLLQNPPAIPAMLVCWLYCFITRTRLIIDWHNYSFTILSLSLGRSHILVKISRYLESLIGRRAYRNLCVTKAMKEDLHKTLGVEASILYDRPHEMFQAVSVEESHYLWANLAEAYSIFRCSQPDKTVFTEVFSNGRVCLKDDRPALLVSSTSWTQDEDFTILLDALQRYEETRDGNLELYPKLICVITGRGPLKEHYNKLIEEKEWRHVHVCTPWLKPHDYPKILGSADLGVCLHTSSSGLDLPMKVVDMFGCGLPVCAINFKCLNELIKHEENGLIFENSEELSEQLLSWFKDFPRSKSDKWKELMRCNLESYRKQSWEENWRTNALPLLS